jgi:nitric-oxide synthase
MRQVRRQVGTDGSYEHTRPELEWACKVAWRNSARCIGRACWRGLQVRDRRHVWAAEDIAAEAVTHIREATNGGQIRPMITVFALDAPGRPGPRILSPQLVRYAGYQAADGGPHQWPLFHWLARSARRSGACSLCPPGG